MIPTQSDNASRLAFLVMARGTMKQITATKSKATMKMTVRRGITGTKVTGTFVVVISLIFS